LLRILCLCSLVLFGSTTASAQVVKSLEFDQDGVLPSADPDIQFRNGAAPGNEVYFSVAGGLLIGNTLPEVNNYVGYTYPSQPPLGGGVSSDGPWSIEARLRILGTGGGTKRFGEMSVFNGSHKFNCFHTTTSVQFSRSNGTKIEVPLDVSQWHVVRMEGAGGGRFDAYVDGVLVGSDIPSSTSSYNGFLFQNNTANRGAHIEWDYVRFASSPQATPVESSSWSSMKTRYR